tara:strand:- start:864 stop:1112 length:249 start_codon:yes stop_codon:yes gene_type:complete
MSSIFMKCSRIRIDLVLRRRGNADFAGASCSTAKSSALPHSLAGSPEWGRKLDFQHSNTPAGNVFSDSGTEVLYKHKKRMRL